MKKPKRPSQRILATIEKTDGSKIQIIDCSILFKPTLGDNIIAKRKKAFLAKKVKDGLLAKNGNTFVPTKKAVEFLTDIHK